MIFKFGLVACGMKQLEPKTKPKNPSCEYLCYITTKVSLVCLDNLKGYSLMRFLISAFQLVVVGVLLICLQIPVLRKKHGPLILPCKTPSLLEDDRKMIAS